MKNTVHVFGGHDFQSEEYIVCLLPDIGKGVVRSLVWTDPFLVENLLDPDPFAGERSEPANF